MTKEEKIRNFDPSSPAAGDGIFGLPFNEDESALVLLPVPWEVTVSYSAGTAKGPDAILEASAQVDLYEPLYPHAWHYGIFMAQPDKWIYKTSKSLRGMAADYIAAFIEGGKMKKSINESLNQINSAGDELRARIKERTLEYLRAGKLVGLVGGDHSTPLGFIEALGELHPEFAILQVDAHMDLRKAYEGFTFSHASIMYNALQFDHVKHLVQVGIRDFSDEEMAHIDTFRANGKSIEVFYDSRMKRKMYEGASWKQITDEIINKLPEYVYISFDIDGLDPKLCPHTGTPVPGGLEFDQAVYLIDRLVESGKTIIGFDLNEVAPGEDEWDANVGARLLYKLSTLILKSKFQRQQVLEKGDPVAHHRRDNDWADKEDGD